MNTSFHFDNAAFGMRSFILLQVESFFDFSNLFFVRTLSFINCFLSVLSLLFQILDKFLIFSFLNTT